MDKKLIQLNELFRKGLDPLELRKRAATKINTTVRGFMARRRLSHYRRGIKEWKWSRCRMAMWLVDMLLANQSKLDAGIKRLRMKQDIRACKIIFNKWNIVCKVSAPLRRAVRMQAENLYNQKRLALLSLTYGALKSVCVGKKSLKTINKDRRELIDSIRQKLSEEYAKNGERKTIEIRCFLNIDFGNTVVNRSTWCRTRLGSGTCVTQACRYDVYSEERKAFYDSSAGRI